MMARQIRTAVGSDSVTLPSLIAYDYAECVKSAPLPFLFQRTAGHGFKGTTRADTQDLRRPRHQQGGRRRVRRRVVAGAGCR
jgi:hypothetical protein